MGTVHRCITKLPGEHDLQGESFDEKVLGLRHSALARDDTPKADYVEGRGAMMACKVRR